MPLLLSGVTSKVLCSSLNLMPSVGVAVELWASLPISVLHSGSVPGPRQSRLFLAGMAATPGTCGSPADRAEKFISPLEKVSNTIFELEEFVWLFRRISAARKPLDSFLPLVGLKRALGLCNWRWCPLHGGGASFLALLLGDKAPVIIFKDIMSEGKTDDTGVDETDGKDATVAFTSGGPGECPGGGSLLTFPRIICIIQRPISSIAHRWYSFMVTLSLRMIPASKSIVSVSYCSCHKAVQVVSVWQWH